MADRFDVAQALVGGVVDRADAWAFIREFSAAWAVPLSSADGFSPEELQSTEERLGHRLPAALHEAYALFGRRRDLVAQHNPWLDPCELLLDPSRQLLVFRSENQGCAGWGVLLAELSHDDPPVVLFSDGLPRSGWTHFLERVSLACVETVLSEAVMATRYGPAGRECEATPEVIAHVVAGFEPVALPWHPAWYEPAGTSVRWFSAVGKLLCLEPGPARKQQLVVVGRRETDLLEILDDVPGAWPKDSPR
jgi:hypothetical protein